MLFLGVITNMFAPLPTYIISCINSIQCKLLNFFSTICLFSSQYTLCVWDHRANPLGNAAKQVFIHIWCTADISDHDEMSAFLVSYFELQFFVCSINIKCVTRVFGIPTARKLYIRKNVTRKVGCTISPINLSKNLVTFGSTAETQCHQHDGAKFSLSRR